MKKTEKFFSLAKPCLIAAALLTIGYSFWNIAWDQAKLTRLRGEIERLEKQVGRLRITLADSEKQQVLDLDQVVTILEIRVPERLIPEAARVAAWGDTSLLKTKPLLQFELGTDR